MIQSTGVTHTDKSAQENPVKYRDNFTPVIITGMSGAGLSTAARVLEDLGWYVAHNIPPQIILELIDMCAREDSPVDKVAVVCDVRSREFRGSLTQVVSELRGKQLDPTVLFLEARDEVLIKRFDNVRRTHPLQGSQTLQVGIERERTVLSPVKEDASVVIDTSDLSVHDLRRAIESSFRTIATRTQHVTIESFGFKHGSPRDADFVVDVRFLPNPFWVPELRPFRGVDKPVSDYVLSQKGAEEFLNNFVDMLKDMLPGYRHEGKNFITIGVGCTGGHHRSVAVSEELAKRIADQTTLDVSVVHRDINRH
ncbi:RNase adapter RapZ [Corynebacterium glutamicum]|uniref:RNase adapter RapZ n=1 Tax=Corynebacterium glutamicum TaxID=1718 RepID=UPI00074482FC|nr:RNase adapter RapZ [Corynebacterium glutamicum]AMA00284.1 RNase adaptor protein RapZ [Corynebacterium glutamicum]MDO5374478.1 RNase adapter RapZ [Corynebacterium glutamicum]